MDFYDIFNVTWLIILLIAGGMMVYKTDTEKQYQDMNIWVIIILIVSTIGMLTLTFHVISRALEIRSENLEMTNEK